MKKTHKYQLLFIGDRLQILEEVTSILKDNFNELKVDELFLNVTRNIEEVIVNQPLVVLVANTKPYLDERYINWLNAGKLAADIILPIYISDFNNEFKDETIKRYNGLRYENPETIASIVMEGFNLLRRPRKLFISYKRSDSREIALQLYNYFGEKNFDVFLDTHTIPKGVDFQANLFHRMMDCDAVLLLDSDNFLESEFCKEELNKAIVNQLGILRIKWPASKINYSNTFIEEFELPSSFDCSRLLDNGTLSAISHQLENLRIRSFASMQSALTTEFISTAKRKGKQAYQIYPNIIGLHEEKRVCVFFAAIGIPTSESFHNAEKLIENLLQEGTEFTLIYNDINLLNEWIAHLDWLTTRTKISTLRKSEFETTI